MRNNWIQGYLLKRHVWLCQFLLLNLFLVFLACCRRNFLGRSKSFISSYLIRNYRKSVAAFFSRFRTAIACRVFRLLSRSLSLPLIWFHLCCRSRALNPPLFPSLNLPEANSRKWTPLNRPGKKYLTPRIQVSRFNQMRSPFVPRLIHHRVLSFFSYFFFFRVKAPFDRNTC